MMMRGLYDACLLGKREEKIYGGGRRRRWMRRRIYGY